MTPAYPALSGDSGSVPVLHPSMSRAKIAAEMVAAIMRPCDIPDLLCEAAYTDYRNRLHSSCDLGTGVVASSRDITPAGFPVPAKTSGCPDSAGRVLAKAHTRTEAPCRWWYAFSWGAPLCILLQHSHSRPLTPGTLPWRRGGCDRCCLPLRTPWNHCCPLPRNDAARTKLAEAFGHALR